MNEANTYLFVSFVRLPNPTRTYVLAGDAKNEVDSNMGSQRRDYFELARWIKPREYPRRMAVMEKLAT
jgi:hypothetical protein